jgi:hypothetical protein
MINELHSSFLIDNPIISEYEVITVLILSQELLIGMNWLQLVPMQL